MLKDNFIITGWVDNPKDYIDLFDYALLTSKWEGFGLAVIEYMACRKIVLASNVGGIVNIVNDGINGYLFDDYEGDKYVERIIYLHQNPEVKERIIDQAYEEVIKKYDARKMINKHEEIFEMRFYEKNLREIGEKNVIDF